MNPQGIVRGKADADESGPLAELSCAAQGTESGLTNKPFVPDYELLRRIGGGAYGEVFLARSRATGVLRAAKIVWRCSFDDDRPFQREFEGIQRFERVSRGHPSQLSLFHIGRNEAEGYFYYVMELADDAGGREAPGAGTSPRTVDTVREVSSRASSSAETAHRYQPRTLRADLNKGRLPAAQALDVGLALTEALSHLHQNGLVHRDVKPSNVIFVNGRPKLADIGLVTDASDTRSIVGTEGYLPREGPGTPQADIFALGKVLYEAVTGLDRREFPKLPDDLRGWPDRNAVVEINEVVLKACAADSEQRYKSCDELQTELTLLHQGKSVRLKRGKKRRLASSRKIAAALFVVALVVVNFAFWQRQLGSSVRSAEGPPSTNMEANALCAKALLILREDNYEQLRTAYTNLYEAIALDPNFARPYVGLLELQAHEYVLGLPRTTHQILLAITGHLEQLAPSLAPTYCAEAVIKFNEWDFPAAAHCSLESIKANPNYEFGHSWYCFMLYMWGRPEEARKQMEIARSLAPSKATIYRDLGNYYFAKRDYTNAIAQYQVALKWEKHHWPAYSWAAEAFKAIGDYTNAFENREKAEVLQGADEAEAKRSYDRARQIVAKGGIAGYWQAQWDGTQKYPDRDFCWKAEIQMRLGHTNEAMDWLEKSYENRPHDGPGYDSPMDFLLFDNCWDGLRGNPRFRALLEKIGFTKVMPPSVK